jgi:hypothetical protein
MKQRTFGKSLAVAVILLLLSLGIQPAVATVNNEDNIPPCDPIIDGPDRGVPGEEYEYIFYILDVDDNVSYLWIDWGDNNSTGWLGPFENGEDLKFSHKWNKEGTFIIGAKAKDIHGAESRWSFLEVNIPRTRESSYLWFLERFPMLERLLGFLR